MLKKVIQIDRDKCVGCGVCANTCHQSAIDMVEGKAKVVRDDVCDGLGRCLPVCPVSAITFAEVEDKRETPQKTPPETPPETPFQCPSMQSKAIKPVASEEKSTEKSVNPSVICPSQLKQWPVQIKLVPITAPYFENAHLLVAADCSAFSYGNFHEEFMKNKITLIGCPKLDEGEYSEKLTQIFMENEIKSVTVARMEVPCCGGIENAVVQAVKNSKKPIPCAVVVLSVDGKVLERR